MLNLFQIILEIKNIEIFFGHIKRNPIKFAIGIIIFLLILVYGLSLSSDQTQNNNAAILNANHQLKYINN